MALWGSIIAFFVCVLNGGLVFAQSESGQTSTNATIDLSVQHYFIPGDSDLLSPEIAISCNDLLILARYNYEGRDAASLWLGRPFSFGESWELELTPMVGGIFSTIEGVAPGLIIDASWERFQLYSEMEYVFDFDTRDENFFYSWSQVTFSLVDWLRIGIVGSRTRAYDTAVELDRGPIIEVDIGSVTLSCTALNVDDDPLIVAGIEGAFNL